MSQGAVALAVISILSILFRDTILAASAAVLFALTFFVDKSTLGAAARPAFSIGIFFLMAFLLMPLASEKVRLSDLTGQFRNAQFFFAMIAAAAVSYLGGRGVAFMQQPYILLAVVLGTLAGVLFLKGLPAGLIIAAGIVSAASELMKH